jgi:hypothetical protein
MGSNTGGSPCHEKGDADDIYRNNGDRYGDGYDNGHGNGDEDGYGYGDDDGYGYGDDHYGTYGHGRDDDYED